MASTDRIVIDLIETTDKILEQIEENYSADLKIAKKFAQELREELEEVLDSHDGDA